MSSFSIGDFFPTALAIESKNLAIQDVNREEKRGRNSHLIVSSCVLNAWLEDQWERRYHHGEWRAEHVAWMIMYQSTTCCMVNLVSICLRSTASEAACKNTSISGDILPPVWQLYCHSFIGYQVRPGRHNSGRSDVYPACMTIASIGIQRQTVFGY